MTATNDFDRLVTSWLESAGPANLSDEVLELALDAARRTTPRRGIGAVLFGPSPWPARRRLGIGALPPALRVALVLGLMAVVAAGAIVVGSRLLDRKPVTVFPVDAIQTYDGRMTRLAAPTGESLFDPLGLPDGRILGIRESGVTIWDPASGQVTDGGPLRTKRVYPVSVVLADGRLLLIGGDRTPPDAEGSTGAAVESTAEVYDPAVRTSSPLTPLGSRWISSAIRLLDGRVLVTGGLDTDGPQRGLATAELFDPATGTFAPTGSMHAPRTNHSMALLPDGRVVVVGGQTNPNDAALSTTEIYDPATRTFSPGDPLDEISSHPDDSRFPLSWHTPVVTLTGGEVIVPGLACQEVHDYRPDGTSDGARETPIEQFDPTTGEFRVVGLMPHCVQQAIPLPNGELFVRGWWYTRTWNVHPWAGIYDPRTGVVRAVEAPTVNGQPYIDTVVLPNGRIVFLGSRVDVME